MEFYWRIFLFRFRLFLFFIANIQCVCLATTGWCTTQCIFVISAAQTGGVPWCLKVHFIPRPVPCSTTSIIPPPSRACPSVPAAQSLHWFAVSLPAAFTEMLLLPEEKLWHEKQKRSWKHMVGPRWFLSQPCSCSPIQAALLLHFPPIFHSGKAIAGTALGVLVYKGPGKVPPAGHVLELKADTSILVSLWAAAARWFLQGLSAERRQLTLIRKELLSIEAMLWSSTFLCSDHPII